MAVFIIALFFFVFAGGGAFQGYLKAALPGEWSPLRVTSLLGIVYLSFMFWRLLIPASQHLLTDKWSLVLAATAYALMPVLLIYTADYRLLAIAAALWGWGAASLWQTGPVWLYDATSPLYRGLWAGILYGAVFLALMGAAKVQGWAADAGQHRLLATVLVPALAAVALSIALPARRARAEVLSVASLRLHLFDGRVLILGGLLFVSATAYGLLLGAFRDSAEALYGSARVGTMLAVFFATRLVVSVFGGFFSDFMARTTVITIAYVAGGVSLAAAASLEGALSMAAAAGCLGLVSGVVPVSVTACTGDWFEPAQRSLALGAAFVWRDMGMVVSLIGGQFLVELSGGFSTPLFVFGALFAMAGAGAMMLPSHNQQKGL